MTLDATHALIRFGLGQRGTVPPPADPRAWLKAQLDGPDSLLGKPGPSTQLGFQIINLEDAADCKLTDPCAHFIGNMFGADRGAALRHAFTTDQPFRERLVLFWANHFTVSGRVGGRVLALLGAYVQEAIRPHAAGRFEDMLCAVMRHSAMLYYLSNDTSIGPDSPVGARTHGGLNENLARECLELHTVGVTAGYTQTDVTNLARVLTGWGVEKSNSAPGFVFRPDQHEPGTNVIMGTTFPDGEAGGLAALHFLATHPATCHHLATKLVQHFVADDPAADDVARIAAVLHDTGGDLKAAALAVTDLPSAWQPLTKLRTPVDYEIAVYRALDLPASPPAEPSHTPVPISAYLGEEFWCAPLPNGWSDATNDWLGGEAMLRRADWAWDLAGHPAAPSSDDVAARTLGDLLTPATRARLAGAPTRREALALLLASPEFMRR